MQDNTKTTTRDELVREEQAALTALSVAGSRNDDALSTYERAILDRIDPVLKAARTELSRIDEYGEGGSALKYCHDLRKVLEAFVAKIDPVEAELETTEEAVAEAWGRVQEARRQLETEGVAA